jgi:hypothetical protein
MERHRNYRRTPNARKQLTGRSLRDDFRSCTARILDNWLGVDSVSILNGDFRAGRAGVF